MLLIAAVRRPSHMPHARASITSSGSTDRTTSPGWLARMSEYCWRQPSTTWPCMQAANTPVFTDSGLSTSATDTRGPAWDRDEVATMGPKASTTPIAPKMRRISCDELYCQCHCSASIGLPAIARPMICPMIAANSTQ